MEKPQWNEKKNNYGKPDFGDLNRHFKNNGIKFNLLGAVMVH
jgi:hypothetical protein